MDLLHRRSTGRGVDLQSGDQRADVLPLEEAIRWAGSRSGAADEATAGAEYAHEATGGRTELGRDDVAGRTPKKVVKPARRRPLVVRSSSRESNSDSLAAVATIAAVPS